MCLINMPTAKKNGWGGKRPGAGRKPVGDKAGVSHMTRPAVSARTPVLVTLRTGADVNLRSASSLAVIKACLDEYGDGFELRVLRYSAAAHELQLLVQGSGKRSLARGMQSLCVRLARGLNRKHETKGKVFVDRYEARALEKPSAVRDATHAWG